MSQEPEAQEFLVVYDYGQAGVWDYVLAHSASEVEEAFPELSMVSERPDWMTDEIEHRIPRNRTVTIDDTETGFLADILGGRNT